MPLGLSAEYEVRRAIAANFDGPTVRTIAARHPGCGRGVPLRRGRRRAPLDRARPPLALAEMPCGARVPWQRKPRTATAAEIGRHRHNLLVQPQPRPVFLFHTAERLARRRHEPGTFRDLRRSRCKRIHAGRRARGRQAFRLAALGLAARRPASPPPAPPAPPPLIRGVWVICVYLVVPCVRSSSTQQGACAVTHVL